MKKYLNKNISCFSVRWRAGLFKRGRPGQNHHPKSPADHPNFEKKLHQSITDTVGNKNQKLLYGAVLRSLSSWFWIWIEFSFFYQKFKFSYSSVRIVVVDSPKVFVRYKWVIVSFFLIQRIQIFEKMKIEKNWKIIEIYILFIYLLEMEELQQINWSCIEITKTKKRFIGTVKGLSGLGPTHNGRIREGSK